MYKLAEHNIYIGTKEEYNEALEKDMNIVCALNRCDRTPQYISHQSVVGWTGRGCNKDNPYYLFKREDKAIYLNMIDGDNPEYIHDSMIDAALSFMKEKLDMDEEVFIYCSLGESRSPSIALMYLLENELINRDVESCRKFQKEYPRYKPNTDVFLYLKNRYKI